MRSSMFSPASSQTLPALPSSMPAQAGTEPQQSLPSGAWADTQFPNARELPAAAPLGLPAASPAHVLMGERLSSLFLGPGATVTGNQGAGGGRAQLPAA